MRPPPPVAASLFLHLSLAGRPALYKLLQPTSPTSAAANVAAVAAASAAAATAAAAGRFGLVRVAAGAASPAVVRQVGEDAAFLTPARGFFGVADGVGGWRERGVDPGDASLALMTACAEEVSADVLRPKAALAAAHERLLATRPKLLGSTTACLARLATAGDSGASLEVANLGDSGLCVFDRRAQLKMRTKFQGNMGGVFNCPSQLAFPREISQQYPGPDSCDVYTVAMEPGDLALMATDGLWDNLYLDTIQHILTRCLQKCDDGACFLETAAQQLVEAATFLSCQQEYFSPFCQNAKAAGLKYIGGKEDDITVILGMLTSCSGAGPPAKL